MQISTQWTTLLHIAVFAHHEDLSEYHILDFWAVSLRCPMHPRTQVWFQMIHHALISPKILKHVSMLLLIDKNPSPLGMYETLELIGSSVVWLVQDRDQQYHLNSCPPLWTPPWHNPMDLQSRRWWWNHSQFNGFRICHKEIWHYTIYQLYHGGLLFKYPWSCQ